MLGCALPVVQLGELSFPAMNPVQRFNAFVSDWYNTVLVPLDIQRAAAMQGDNTPPQRAGVSFGTRIAPPKPEQAPLPIAPPPTCNNGSPVGGTAKFVVSGVTVNPDYPGSPNGTFTLQWDAEISSPDNPAPVCQWDYTDGTTIWILYYNYTDYPGTPLWSLTIQTADSSGAYFIAQVNTITGAIPNAQICPPGSNAGCGGTITVTV
jgi:hypothetical protein